MNGEVWFSIQKMKKDMKAKSIIIVSFFGIVLYILFDCMLYFLEKPKIEISKIEYPPLKLDLKTSKINTIISIDFFSETKNEYVWSLFIAQNIKLIRFGNVSQGWEQIYPVDGKPREFFVGEKIYFCIHYQYDYIFAPSAGAKIWLLEIDKDNKIIMHGEFSNIKLPFRPKS